MTAALRASYAASIGFAALIAISVSTLCSCQSSCQSRGSADRTTSSTPDAAALQQLVEDQIDGFRGVVGVYVEHTDSGTRAGVRADEIFPTASMIKVPILCALYDRIARGELDKRKPLVWSTKRIYPGDDLCAKLVDGSAITLSKLVLLMESLSDNTASLWCQELAGTGTKINEWLAARGFVATRMNSRTPGRKADWERYGWGQTSPREMATLVRRIRDGRDLPPDLAREAYRSLCRSAWDDTALAPLPLGVEVASKQGAVARSRSEVFLVHAPGGEYVCCVITKDQKDASWQRENEGAALLRRLSAALWDFFEGDDERGSG